MTVMVHIVSDSKAVHQHSAKVKDKIKSLGAVLISWGIIGFTQDMGSGVPFVRTVSVPEFESMG